MIAEAEATRAEALQLGDTVKAQIQELDQRRISIEVQGRALMPEELVFIEKVNQLTARFSEWEREGPDLKGKPAAVLQDQQHYLQTVKSIGEQATTLLEQ
jgi:hypothetical protein